MVSKYFSAGLLLAIVGVCSCLDSGYYDCPDDSKAVTQIGDVQGNVPAAFLGVVTLDVRVPSSGLAPLPISCVIATDLSGDGTGGNVVVVGGGLNSKYVELKITSEFWKPIKYHVEVFTDAAPTTTAPTTTIQ